MTQNSTLRTLAGLHVPYARHPAVRKLKRQGHLPSIHGTKLWGASHILIDFLSKDLADPPRSIIDVGCGWVWPVSGVQKHMAQTSRLSTQIPM